MHIRVIYSFVLWCFLQAASNGQGVENESIALNISPDFAVTVDHGLYSLILHKKRKYVGKTEKWWRFGFLLETDLDDSKLISSGQWKTGRINRFDGVNQIYFLFGHEKIWSPIDGYKVFQLTRGFDISPGYEIAVQDYSTGKNERNVMTAKGFLFGGIKAAILPFCILQLESGIGCSYATRRYYSGLNSNPQSTQIRHYFEINYLPIRAIRLGITF